MATFLIQLSILLTGLFFAGCTIEAYENDAADTAKVQLDVGESKNNLDDDSPDKAAVQTLLHFLNVSYSRCGILSFVSSFLLNSSNYLIRAPPQKVMI